MKYNNNKIDIDRWKKEIDNRNGYTFNDITEIIQFEDMYQRRRYIVDMHNDMQNQKYSISGLESTYYTEIKCLRDIYEILENNIKSLANLESPSIGCITKDKNQDLI